MCGCETDCQTCAELLRMIELEKKPASEVDRLTMVARVYHQRMGKEATGVDRAYSQILQTREQTYSRELEVTEELEKLNFGWIQVPSMVVIENIVGTQPRKVQPNNEELIDERKRVIEVLFGAWPHAVVALLIPPGMVQPFIPATNLISIRCRHATASYIITAIPK